ncbi:hypothetical protein [Curtobacterium sp. 20TX0008]|nr:hypothetical protein [Curtobacterium sp. 20TX0008]
MYANEIVAVLYAGGTPTRQQIEAWARYNAAAQSENPGAVLGSASTTGD